MLPSSQWPFNLTSCSVYRRTAWPVLFFNAGDESDACSNRVLAQHCSELWMSGEPFGYYGLTSQLWASFNAEICDLAACQPIDVGFQHSESGG